VSDPPAGFRLPGYADCLAAFIDRLAPARPHVVGVGFGANVAMELYRRHPTLPQSLVLSTAFPGWADSLPAAVVARRLQWCRRETGLLSLSEGFERGWIFGVRMEAATANVDEGFVASMPDAPPAGFSVLARSLAEASFADFALIDVPMLALYAVHDERPRRIRADAHRAPAGTIAMLPGIGNPASGAPDRFNTEVLDFIRARM